MYFSNNQLSALFLLATQALYTLAAPTPAPGVVAKVGRKIDRA
jgi:hypothetical protein